VVPDRLAKLYGTPWFTQSVRVDVVRVTSREGAFTSIDPPPAYITIASGNPNMAGWMAAEVLFHEASHALAMPLIQAFGAEQKAQGKLAARDLWHVALFYLTGEVVRQTLEARNIKFEPYLYQTGLFDRAWPQYKTAIETHWQPFVDGKVSREAAIKNVVSAIPKVDQRAERRVRRSGAGLSGVPASDGDRGSGGTKSPGNGKVSRGAAIKNVVSAIK
jgi:hypothetical protein